MGKGQVGEWQVATDAAGTGWVVSPSLSLSLVCSDLSDFRELTLENYPASLWVPDRVAPTGLC